MKAKFVKYSICVCGFPILDESITLGTLYEIEPLRTMQATMVCGGCGKWNKHEAIWVERRGKGRAGWLPREIFELIGEPDFNGPPDPPESPVDAARTRWLERHDPLGGDSLDD